VGVSSDSPPVRVRFQASTQVWAQCADVAVRDLGKTSSAPPFVETASTTPRHRELIRQAGRAVRNDTKLVYRGVFSHRTPAHPGPSCPWGAVRGSRPATSSREATFASPHGFIFNPGETTCDPQVGLARSTQRRHHPAIRGRAGPRMKTSASRSDPGNPGPSRR